MIGAYAFSVCTSLTSVTIPDSVISIGGGAFYGCNSALYTEYEYGKYIGNSENPYQVLIEVTNQNLSTYKIHEDTKIIAYGVFGSCVRLTSITIPDSVTAIGEYAFRDCYSLTSVTIPDSVATIGGGAFYGCTSLTSVTIGDSVISIGDRAFENCSSLTSVYYKGTTEKWSEISIGDWNYNLTNATRYYYSETTPTEEGNYWHYDAEGKIEIWE